MEKITEIYFHSLKILFKAPDFKKSIDNFYISKISEFESRKNQSNFKEYLNNQHKEISQTFFQNKRLSKLHPKLSNEIEFVCVTMESLLHQIDVELNRLEHEKAQSNKKGVDGNKRAVNVCVGNVEMNKPTFEKMLTKMNELFFDNSEIDQWESIIKNASPTHPIRVKKTTSIVDLRLFFDLLSENEIFENEYLTPLINLNAFFLTNPKQNKILEYDQLKQAKKYINKRKIKPQFSIYDFLA